MFRFNSFINQKFLAPDDTSNAGVVDKELGKEGMIDFLSDDSEDEGELINLDEKKEKGKKVEKEEVEEEKVEEEKEETEEEEEEKSLEDELEEELLDEDETDEDKLELTTPVSRREILKKYPNIFKEFPYLEHAYYREREFTEIYPTLDDARDAKDKAEVFGRIERDLVGGNTENILKAIKNENINSFHKIVDNYLSTLAAVDETAYHHVIGNTIKHTIIAMANEARNSQNETLQAAAQVLNQFVFGSSQFGQPTKLAKEEKTNEEDARVTRREQEFTQRQFESTRDGLNSKVNNVVRATIERNIDPKESMTDYVKKTAIRDAHEQLSELISKDSRFKSIADKLWERAIKDNFSTDSVNKIRQAYLAKAKTLLPSVIKKARIEALKGLGKRVNESIEEKKDKRGPVAVGRESSHNRSPKNDREKAKAISSNMRSIDYLMSED